MNTPYVFRKCRKCGKILLLTTDNFRKSTDKRDGKTRYRHDCRECEKKYRELNKEHIKNQKKEYYEKNKEHINEQEKQYREANKEAIKERKKKYREANIEVIKERRKQYYEKNKEYINEQRKEYAKEYNKKYRQTVQGQVIIFNNRNKRRSQKINQGKGITIEQWKEVYEYFNWNCAYSEIELSKDNRNLDHIIPLSKGGSNNIWNMIPMLNIYNFSKQDKLPLEWYKEQEYFSEERLAKIVEWQQYAYDKWATEEDDELILITDLK